MKAIVLFTILAVITGIAAPGPGGASETPKAGSPFPRITLPTPKSPEHRTYLGLSEGDEFSLSDIKAEVLIIEIFSMYCPHCQREAPTLNRLYRKIEDAEDLKGRVKLIGIGAGNSAFEIDVFRKKYAIPFPLFPDGKFEIHKLIGEVRTPYFFGLRTGQAGQATVFFSKLGGAKDAGALLEELMRHSELERTQSP
jgi:thiol-disulfide isomerase/thioredoxin